MKPQQADSKIKQVLLKAGTYLDMLSPIVGALWIFISIVPDFIAYITIGSIPASTILQTFLISELGILFVRQTTSFSSWLSDTTGYVDRTKKNDEIANTLRGLQLSLLLIAFLINLAGSILWSIKIWADAVTALAAAVQSPAFQLATQICSYVPIISIAAGVLGTSVYVYQAYQANKDIERYQAKVDEIDSNYAQYTELYKKILEPGANITKLCKGLPKDAGEYLFQKQFYEHKKQESQKSKKGFLFWAGMCAVGLTLAVLAAAAALTPLGPMVIAGTLTVSIAVKACTFIGLVIMAAATISYYVKNKFDDAERRQMERTQQKIDQAVKIIHEDNEQNTNIVQYAVVQQKTAQGQPAPTEPAVTIKPASSPIKPSNNYDPRLLSSGKRSRVDEDEAIENQMTAKKPRTQ